MRVCRMNYLRRNWTQSSRDTREKLGHLCVCPTTHDRPSELYPKCFERQYYCECTSGWEAARFIWAPLSGKLLFNSACWWWWNYSLMCLMRRAFIGLFNGGWNFVLIKFLAALARSALLYITSAWIFQQRVTMPKYFRPCASVEPVLGTLKCPCCSLDILSATFASHFSSAFEFFTFSIHGLHFKSRNQQHN
jgi:hypothetical protein